MQCYDCHEWMSSYLDGLLDQEQAMRLQAHLTHCEACRREWEAMGWLSSVLDAEPVATPAPDFTARVMLRLQQREARRRRLHSSISVLMGSVGLWSVAAAGLLLLFVALWQPLIRILLYDVMLPLVNNVLSFLVVLGKALYAVANELSRPPAWLLLPAYAVLALGLTALWMQVVLRPWKAVPQMHSKN